MPSFICVLVNSSQNSFWDIFFMWPSRQLCDPGGQILLSFPFNRCGNGGSGRLTDLPKTAQLRSCQVRARIYFPWILLSFYISLTVGALQPDDRKGASTCMKSQADPPLSYIFPTASHLNSSALTLLFSITPKPTNAGNFSARKPFLISTNHGEPAFSQSSRKPYHLCGSFGTESSALLPSLEWL